MNDELPEVRPASCGHGFLPIDAPPDARTQVGVHQREVWLCEDCRHRMRSSRVETKDVRPEASPPSSPPDARADGQRTAAAGGARRPPAGIHPRSAWAREWYAAYDEAAKGGEG